MKRVICLLSCFALIIPGWSQVKLDNWKNIKVLAEEKEINLIIDFSGSTILDVDFEEWVKAEKDWDDSYANIRKRFIQGFNGMANSGRFPHKVGSYVDAEYTITITIENVYYNGSEIQSLVTIAN